MYMAWLVEKRIILVDVGKRLTTEDLINMNDGIVELLDIGDAKVHIIFQATELRSFPISVSVISNIFTFIKHENLGWDITIGTNRVIKFISKLVNVAEGRRATRYVSTYEEAINTLQTFDPTLTDVPIHINE